MVTLYVISTTPYAGKSALCVALGRRFRRDGHKVGYMRPVTTTVARIKEHMVDAEAELMRQNLDLKEAADLIWPVCLDPHVVESILHGDRHDYAKVVGDAFAKISKDKDVMLVEGGSTLTEGSMIDLSCKEISEQLLTKSLVMAKYSSESTVDDLLAARKWLGAHMIGAVLDAVERPRMDFVQNVVVPFLASHGIPVYASLPLERIFSSITVGQLAEALQGEIICRPDLANELVENLMVGAMSVDASLAYFRRKLNKAVITGGDRPDIQLAALETSTRALVLTGNFYPNPLIVSRAEEAGVPIILVKHDTLTTVQLSEQAFEQIRFHHERKLERFERILAERFRFDDLYKDLGL